MSDKTRDDGGFEALHAWLILLPAFVLAWPLPAALQDVPTTASGGAGWAALASVPAVLLLFVRRAAPLSIGLGCLLLLALLAEVRGFGAVDAFESQRALTVLATGLALAASAASLGPNGRRILTGGFALASLLFVLSGLLGDGGAAGNSGDLSEAALPGAVCALALFVGSRGFVRALGLGAALAYALFAGLMPVYAGVVGFLAAVGVALALALLGRGTGRHARIGLIVALVLALAVGAERMFGGASATADTTTSADALAAPAPRAGGVEFRRLTWARVPRLVQDHPGGVGPGQFERSFPPYRDPAEILVSSIGGREPTPQDVEHPHNDWLLAFAEYGVAGGALFAIFLLAALLGGLRALATGDLSRAGPALAAVAILVNAGVNSPLLVPVSAHVIAFPLLGACLGGARRSKPRGGPWMLLPALCALLLANHASGALGFIKHGNALAGLKDAVHAETNTLDPARAVAPIQRALRAAPESVIAMEQRVRLPDLSNEQRMSLYEQILLRRPHRRAVLINLANQYARADKLVEARAQYARVLALDPHNTLALRNNALLAVNMSLVGPVEEALEAWARVEQINPGWLRQIGAEQLLRGRLDIAQAVLGRYDVPVFESLDANTCFALAKARRDAGDDLMDDALTAGFQLQMGREHAQKASYSLALRSYRQALQAAARHKDIDGVMAGLSIELAAVELLAGRRADALQTLDEVEKPLKLADIKHRPGWAVETLLDAQLLSF